MLNRVSWTALAAVLFLCGAFACAAVKENTFALVFALGSITWAVLSLKEQT